MTGVGKYLKSKNPDVKVVAVCPPKVLGQVKHYVEGWHEEREDWEL